MEERSTQQFDEERASAYDDRIRRLAPGYDVLHEVLADLLSTMLQPDAHLLIVGAGTGTEIIQLGRAQPDWRFTAVDPSAEMLDRCRGKVSEAGLASRVEYVCDRVEDVPTDPVFDAATSIFVAHFIQEPAAKRRFFQAIADRVRPQAPFVLADLYNPSCGTGAAFGRLLAAWRRSFERSGTDPEEVERIFGRIEHQIDFVREDELEHLLDTAQFASPTRFYQSLLWGAWWTRRE